MTATSPLTITLERVGNVGYWHVRRGSTPLGDIRGSRTLGFDAGAPGLTEHWGTYPDRDLAIQAILDQAGAA